MILQSNLLTVTLHRMMSKGFPQVPENILLEPDDIITYSDEESYNYDHERNQEGGDKEGEEAREGAVRGVLTKRLWNYILSRSAIPVDTKYVLIPLLILPFPPPFPSPFDDLSPTPLFLPIPYFFPPSRCSPIPFPSSSLPFPLPSSRQMIHLSSLLFSPNPVLTDLFNFPFFIRWEKATKIDINKVVSELLTGRYAVTGGSEY
jgi:hypothetical protein